MKIIASHLTDCHRLDRTQGSIREALFLDHIGDELRGVYGDVDQEPLPDTLSALASLLDRRVVGGDAS